MTILYQNTKNGTTHVVPLFETARAIVTTQIGKHQEYVFIYKGHKLKEVNTMAFRKALKQTSKLTVALRQPTHVGINAGSKQCRCTSCRK